jgi:hypothetical protein
MSFSCSAAVNLGSVVNACQYLRAALAPGSGRSAFAGVDLRKSARTASARHIVRGMHNTPIENDQVTKVIFEKLLICPTVKTPGVFVYPK